MNIDVRVLFYTSIVMKVHRPIPNGSYPFCKTAEDILLKFGHCSSFWFTV